MGDKTDTLSEGTGSRLLLLDRTGSGKVLHIPIDWKDKKLLGTSENVYSDCWSKLEGLQGFSAVVADNVLYVIGGFDRNRKQCTNQVFSYDPCTNGDKWETQPNMRIPRAAAAAAVLDGRIHVTGGMRDGGKPTRSSEIFRLDTKEWIKGGLLPAGRKSHACAADGNAAYASGGNDGRHTTDNIWVFENHWWHELDEDYPPRLPQRLEGHSMVQHAGYVYFLGGHIKGQGACSGRIHCYYSGIRGFQDTSDQYCFISPWVWDLPNMNYPRHNAAAVVLGDKIYLLGGSGTTDGSGTGLRMVECLDLTTKQWSQAFTLPQGTYKDVTGVILHYPEVAEQKVEVAQPPQPLQQKCRDTYRWILW